MEFGSIHRRNGKSGSSSSKQAQNARARRSFSTSNLSFTSSSSTSIGRQTLYLSLPKDLSCERGHDGRVLHLIKGGPAHSSGVIQVGDLVDLSDDDEPCHSNDEEMVTVRVTYGVLHVDNRPPCPLVIKIGNKSNTSLGIALGDTSGKQIKITSIQAGSLADRCGFLKVGDLLTAIQISSNETIPCSPFYTSFQVAQILRKLTTSKSSITLTIVPVEEIVESDNNSGSTITLRDSPLDYHHQSQPYGNMYGNKQRSNKSMTTFQDDGDDKTEYGAENECILSLSLWKDRLYEDWGFSLIDDDEDDARIRRSNNRFGAFVHQIRPGGPAFLAGLQPRDRFLQINDRDVANLESTIIVPMLASLDDAPLNVVIQRRHRANINQ